MKEPNESIRGTIGPAYNQAVVTRSHADLNNPSDCKFSSSGKPGALRYRQTAALSDLPEVRSLLPLEGGTLTTVNRVFLQNPSTPASSLEERYSRKDAMGFA